MSVMVELTERELNLVMEALDELIFEYEHHVEPPSRRGGAMRERGGPDTSELEELLRKLRRLRRSG